MSITTPRTILLDEDTDHGHGIHPLVVRHRVLHLLALLVHHHRLQLHRLDPRLVHLVPRLDHRLDRLEVDRLEVDRLEVDLLEVDQDGDTDLTDHIVHGDIDTILGTREMDTFIVSTMDGKLSFSSKKFFPRFQSSDDEKDS